MKILFVNNIFPLFAKSDSGASVRSMRLIKALTKLGHVDVISFLDDETSNLEGCDVVYSKYIQEESLWYNNWEKIRLITHQYHLQDIWPLNERKCKAVKTIINQNEYDIIVVRYMKMAGECGLVEYADKLVVDVDDDPKSVIRMLHKTGSLLGRLFWHYVYANAVDRMTNYVLDRIMCAFNSQPEKRYPNTTYLPNISIFSTALPDVDFASTPQNILFVGRMDHKPNAQALKHFLLFIFPILLKSHPTASLRVVGEIKQPELLQLCRSIPNVVLCGFVGDILTEYRKCRCVVIPLITGTGTSVKLVEAMSLNRAVVTTSVGARGLNDAFVQGEDYLLEDRNYEFAKAVSLLLEDEIQNHRIANSACQKVKKYYSEELFNKIVKEAISYAK